MQLWYEQVEWLKQHPIDVNAASASDFLQIPGLPEEMARFLVAFRKKHGLFHSKAEVQRALNLSSEDWLWLSPFIRIKNRRSRPLATVRWRLGPVEADWRGSPLPKIYQRVTWSGSGGVSAGVLLVKSPGGADQPPHTVGFLNLPLGRTARLLFGHYFLHFGRGLVFNLPTSFGKGQSPNQILRPPGAAVRGDLSTLRGFYLQGAALRWQRGAWQGIFFLSQNHWRAVVDSVSGVARLLSSQNGAGPQVEEKLAGFHLKFNWRFGNWGLSGLKSRFARPVFGLNEKTPLRNLPLWGTDAHLRFSRFTLSGAWAQISGREPSFLLGAEIRLTRLEWVWLVRRYGTNFWNPHASVFGEEDDPTNEKGAYTGLIFRPVRKTRLEIFLDQFRFPGSSQGFPGRRGWEWRLRWTQTWSRGLRTQFALAQKEKQEKCRVLRNGWDAAEVLAFRNRWKGQFFWWLFPKSSLHLKGQVQFVRVAWPLLPQKSAPKSGFLLTQEFRWKFRRWLSLAAGWTLFQTETYDSRLYLYEPGLPGTFSVFLAYGTGSRFFILPQVELGSLGKLSLKYAVRNRFTKPGVNYRISPPEPPWRTFSFQADFRF